MSLIVAAFPVVYHRVHTADIVRAQFKEDPDAWLMVDEILSKATHDQTKCWCSPPALTSRTQLLTQ